MNFFDNSQILKSYDINLSKGAFINFLKNHMASKSYNFSLIIQLTVRASESICGSPFTGVLSYMNQKSFYNC